MKTDKRKGADSDLAQSAAALRRAAQQARRDAERTRTPLVTYANGMVVKRMVVREGDEKNS
ncbi:hypothetical protein [Chrysiogenes arsenatis]|uniref:hypothetical protein n=1 Tax=Chrysiogenes arsenatis TaxID=309797 RepID=UPI00041BE64B|nr:hypothetical protein [Chrysiogenes arsenatis]